MSELVRSFWVRVEPRKYAAADLDHLRRHLEQQDAATEFVDLAGPDVLEMTPEGSTVDGYRFTSAAFRAVAGCLATGLKTLVDDLSGAAGRSAQTGDHQVVSPAGAADVFNAVLSSRFEYVLSGKILVSDSQHKTFDGVVTEDYQRKPNLEFFEQVHSAMEGTGTYRFESAALVGRLLSAHYVTDQALWTDPVTKERLFGGYHFLNSETGEQALHMHPTAMFEHGGRIQWTSRAANGRRLRHAGRRFATKVRNALRRATAWEHDVAYVTFAMERLSRKLLGFSGTDEDKDDQRFRELMWLLRMRGLTQALAARALRGAIRRSCGLDGSDSLGRSNRDGWANTSAMHLLRSVIDGADRHGVILRARLETTAHKLMNHRQLLS
jgi:hypothetical protein